MGYKQERKVVRFGGNSRAVVLPKGWLEFYGLDRGDKITVLGDSILVVCTQEDEQRARKVLGLMEKAK